MPTAVYIVLRSLL